MSRVLQDSSSPSNMWEVTMQRIQTFMSNLELLMSGSGVKVADGGLNDWLNSISTVFTNMGDPSYQGLVCVPATHWLSTCLVWQKTIQLLPHLKSMVIFWFLSKLC